MDDFKKALLGSSLQQLSAFARYGSDLQSIGQREEKRSYRQRLQEDEMDIRQGLKDLLQKTDIEKYQQMSEHLNMALESTRNVYLELGMQWGAKLIIDLLFNKYDKP